MRLGPGGPGCFGVEAISERGKNRAESATSWPQKLLEKGPEKKKKVVLEGRGKGSGGSGEDRLGSLKKGLRPYATEKGRISARVCVAQGVRQQ